MRLLLTVREALSRFYGKYDTIIRLLFKFAAAFLIFLAIRAVLGQTAVINHPAVLLILAAVCIFLPSNAIILVAAGLILVHFYGISLEAALVGGGILVIGLLVYFSLAPQSAWPLLLTGLALGGKMGCVPAVLFGLLGGPLGAVGAAFGALSYYLIQIVKDNGANLQSTAAEAAEAMVQKAAQLIQAVIVEREMLVMAAALAAALLVVYFIRIQAIKYAWMIAAAVGCAAYLAVRICGAVAFGVSFDALQMVAEIVVTLFAGWIAQTMLFHLDYKKTQNVRFEDDEYYYYVKAVPKKKIHRRKRRRRAEGR